MNINLTAEQTTKLKSLSITDAALAQLAEEIKPVTLDQVLPVIAGSVLGLTESVYFKRSRWFREQPRHTIEVCSVTLYDNGTMTPEEGGSSRPVVVAREVRPVLVLEQGVLGTLAEMPVAEDYYDQRVLEETRVDYF